MTDKKNEIILKSAVVDRVNVGIFSINQSLVVSMWNNFMEVYSGRKASEIVGKNILDCFEELPRQWLQRKIDSVFILGNFAYSNWQQRPYLFRFPHNRPVTGEVEYMLQDATFIPVKNSGGEVKQVIVSLFDVTDIGVYQARLKEVNAEQQLLIKKLEEAQGQLVQSEKLAGIGQLAAGVAHEINNPVGFVASNLGTLRNYVGNLLRLLGAYEQADSLLEQSPEIKTSIEALKKEIEIDYLKDDLNDLLNESDDGVKRVRQIVQDLRDFSRVDSGEWENADINRGIDSTLNVANNELKYKAEIVKEYGDIPQIECMLSQLNQVFMNLLVNAAQALDERGTITIRTGQQDEQIWIEISDTGKGMDQETVSRIFDPFYTTKPIGKGTGLGLSVSYGIIDKHHGRIEVDSEVGKGTTFRIWLPLGHEEREQEAS